MLQIVATHRDAPAPSVGIFWRVGPTLLVDRSALARAETYGERLTHARGHYELWEAWRAMGPKERASICLPEIVGSTEYDQWPRGRIVYEISERRFVIFADRRLTAPPVVTALTGAFGLTGESVVTRLDPHYR